MRDLVAGSDVTLEDRGMCLLKGIDGDWRLLAAAREPGRLARRLGLSRTWWRIASNERVLRRPQAHELDRGNPVVEDSGL